MYFSTTKGKGHPTHLVTAFDELCEINRRLFNIQDMDKHLSVSDRKNICIVTKSSQSTSSPSSFLYSIIAELCINYRTCAKMNDKIKENNKTILVDADNGNNLGQIYINLEPIPKLSSCR